jgi:cell division protein FtsX
MGGWLVRSFTLFGMPVQHWMLITVAIILIGIVMAWWPRR